MKLRTLTLVLVALFAFNGVLGCGGGGSSDSGDGNRQGNSEDGRTPPPIIQGRNSQEFIIPGEIYHPLHDQGFNSDLLTVATFPQGEGPFPACIILHGSGGLFKNDEPCSEDVADKFDEIRQLLNDNGVAAILPASFFSRNPFFCEDNSDARDHAPPPFYPEGDTEKKRNEAYKKRRIAIRTLDLLATMEYACDLEQVDCNRLCITGTSNGGTIMFHYIHRFLHNTFAEFFARPADQAALLPLGPAVIPENRPMPKFVQAISPGCGLRDAILNGNDAEGKVNHQYYPDVPLFLEIGDNDGIPDACAQYSKGNGERQDQADGVVAAEGLPDHYNVRVHPSAGHGLLDETPAGDLIRTKLIELVDQFLR